MKKGREQPNEKKVAQVEEFSRLISSHNVVGIISLYKTPASALQKIKKELKGKADIRVAKKSVLIRALEKSGKQNLAQFVTEYPGIMLADENPFKLYMFLQKKKTPAAAKPGDIAPNDIEVKAGPTDIMPGPAISTLSKIGLAARVEGGKIAVAKDKVVLKAGEKVSLELASALQLLKLQPMEIGLNVAVIDEKGTVYNREQLFVDDQKLIADIQRAVHSAFNLSINAEIPEKETIGFMLAKGSLEAKALASEAKIEV